LGVLLAMLLAGSAWPQASTGTVSGTVRDQSAAVIPEASVTLTNTGTNVASRTKSNQAGFYLFPGIIPGEYRLAVESGGMQKFEGTLTVQVQQSAVVDVVMKVGQTVTEVAVRDLTPLVSTDNPTLGGTLERRRIEQLPINGRNVTNLLQTVPGQEGTGRAFGLRDGAFEAVLDGSAMADRLQYGSSARITFRQPGLDSIQEFKVENNSSSAKFTRPTSIIMTTKGGTNSIHGSAFETNRNNGLGLARARTDYYTKPPFLNRNEFGASAGGPVYIPKLYNGKNRTFWFFSFEGLRNIGQTTRNFSLPTAALRGGDMTGLVNSQGQMQIIYDPWSTDATTWARTPYSGNQIPVSKQNPLSKYLLDVTPMPTLPNVNPLVASNFFGPVSRPNRSWTTSTRIDQRLGERDQFYGRYTQGQYSSLTDFYHMPTTNYSKVPANTETVLAPNKSVAISWVHTFSPTLFNELLVSGTRQAQWDGTGDPTVDYAAQLGLPNPFTAKEWPYLYGAGINGLEWVGQNTNAWHSFYSVLDDNATKIHGRHELQFGFHMRYDQLNEMPDQQFTGGSHEWGTGATSLYDPTSSRTNPLATPFTGDSFANFFLGVANYTNQMNQGYWYYRQKEYAGYFQDNWKVTPRLTLNLGLRYEYTGPINEKNNNVTGFDLPNHAIVLGTSLDSLYNLGYTRPSVVNRLVQLGAKFETWDQAGLPRSLMYSNKGDFGPRVGLAYRAGDGAKAFVVRAGYRISYFHIPLYAAGARMRKNSPTTATFQNSVSQASYSPDGIGNYGMRSVPTTLIGVNSSNIVTTDAVQGLSPGSGLSSYFAPHSSDPRVQDWNFTIEKEIKGDTVVRVGYFGNHTDHLENLIQVNNPTPAYIWYLTTGNPLPTGSLSSVLIQPYDQKVYSRVEYWQNIGWGNSNGVQLGIERRYNKGLAYQLFYVMDNNFAAGGQGFGGTSVIQTPNVYLPGQVPADFDAFNKLVNYQRDISTPKHRVRWNYVVDLPFGQGKPILGGAGKWLNRLVGGWQTAGIGSLGSTYYTLPTGLFPTSTPVQIYGYKYPVQNCTSGTCYPGYLWWNGYIPANQINSTDPKTGKPNGYMGIPADYKPAVQPIWPWPADYNSSVGCAGRTGLDATVCPYYGGNTLWVPLNNGSVQRTTWTGLPPLQHQYIPSVLQWNTDASLFKTIPIAERFNVRFQADFFNVFNHPGNPNSVGQTGILSTQSSGNSPRTLQLTLRLQW
jgi:hypothetical protein